MALSARYLLADLYGFGSIERHVVRTMKGPEGPQEAVGSGGQGPVGSISEPKTTRTEAANATIDSPPPRSPHFRRVRAAVCSYVGAEMGCIGGVWLRGA